jgi:hypothetical protein
MIQKSFRLIILYRYKELLSKTYSITFLELNKEQIYKVIKSICESKLLSELILTYNDDKFLKIFKYFVEKRKLIFEILTQFNTNHNLYFNFDKINLFVEYIIFFVNITCNNDVYNSYGILLKNIELCPLLYPEFTEVWNAKPKYINI